MPYSAKSDTSWPVNMKPSSSLVSILFGVSVASTVAYNGSCHDHRPMHLRLAYAGSTGMHVSWNTFSHIEQPRVHFGECIDHLDQQASSNISVTYRTSTTYNNHVKLSGLKPNTKYYYQPECSNSTTPFTFVTSRAAGDHTPFTAAVVVDMGTMGSLGLSTSAGIGGAVPLKPGENNTIESIESMRHGFDFLWHRKFDALTRVHGAVPLTVFSR